MERFSSTPQARGLRVRRLKANGRSWLTCDAMSRGLLTLDKTLGFTRHQLAELLDDSRVEARERVNNARS